MMRIENLKNLIEQAKDCLLNPNKVSIHILETLITRYNKIVAEVNDENKLPKIETFNPNSDFDYDNHLSENGVEKLFLIKIWAQGYVNCEQNHSSVKGYLQSISQSAQELYKDKDNANIGALKALITAYNKIVLDVKCLNGIEAFNRKKDMKRSNPRISEAGLKKIKIIIDNLNDYINTHSC